MEFRQVDVFGSAAVRGNPLAVVHDGDDLTDDAMAAFANWTNLSETTFLLRPTHPDADYRVRIFTTSVELPFAGHPTLGSAHAWLAGGGVPKRAGVIVQECGAGLVRIRHGEQLAFAAPPLTRRGPVEPELLERIRRACSLDPADVLAAQWVQNGPQWVGLELASAQAVLDLDPDPALGRGLIFGVIGRHTDGPADVEVRAFFSEGHTFVEDPVTGSLNAGLAQWLIGSGRLPREYVARQGTALGRDGRVHVSAIGEDIWIGGSTHTVIHGTVTLWRAASPADAPGSAASDVPGSATR